jgi:alkylation response protein AidB-like acyl-CoA dehydrogenase
VFFNDVFVPADYLVGQRGRGFQYISEALDLERFTMFTYSPILARFELLCEYVRVAERDGEPLRRDPIVRQRIAQLATQHEVARVLGLRFVAAAKVGQKPPTLEASEYKLYATQLSQRAANAGLDIAGADGQLAYGEPGAPMKGRFDSAYRATVVETIGGGSSEIQKNIIARRGLGLPKNF